MASATIRLPSHAGNRHNASNQQKEGDMSAKKQSTSKTSTLAAKVLTGVKKPTTKEVKSLAASVLGQDEKKGKR
jgi:hypothetical protein